MTFNTEQTEPRACITLRLGEIEALLQFLPHARNPEPGSLAHKLLSMRDALIRNAQVNVPALVGDLEIGP